MFDINYYISAVDVVLSFVSFVKKYSSVNGVAFSRPVFINDNDVESNVLNIKNMRTIWTQ